MNDRERNRYETFLRMRQFGLDNTGDFPAGTIAAAQFNEISEVIELVENYAAGQAVGFSQARFAYAAKDTARENLRDVCSELVRTARVMAYQHPGVDTMFRLPVNRSDMNLISIARAFLLEGEHYEAAFVEYGLPVDFLAQLEAEINAFEAALAPTGEALSVQVEATAQAGATIRRGMVARRILDGIVRNRYRGNVGKLAAWTSASHIEREPRRETPPLETA
jgi:hypothetical protein